jgi:hypothetical protein
MDLGLSEVCLPPSPSPPLSLPPIERLLLMKLQEDLEARLHHAPKARTDRGENLIWLCYMGEDILSV